MGRTTWWEGVREGRYPQPEKLGPRITVWRVEVIRELIANPQIESPQQNGSESQAEAKDDEAAQAEAKRREDDEDEESEADEPVAA